MHDPQVGRAKNENWWAEGAAERQGGQTRLAHEMKEEPPGRSTPIEAVRSQEHDDAAATADLRKSTKQFSAEEKFFAREKSSLHVGNAKLQLPTSL